MGVCLCLCVCAQFKDIFNKDNKTYKHTWRDIERKEQSFFNMKNVENEQN